MKKLIIAAASAALMSTAAIAQELDAEDRALGPAAEDSVTSDGSGVPSMDSTADAMEAPDSMVDAPTASAMESSAMESPAWSPSDVDAMSTGSIMDEDAPAPGNYEPTVKMRDLHR